MDHSVNQIVAIPNWSFFDPDLCSEIHRELLDLGLSVQYVQGDVDHLRTVTAFSGTQAEVFKAMNSLVAIILPKIDIRRETGVHPRVGGLDVAPFVLLEGLESELIEETRAWAEQFSLAFSVPVHLYEKAALADRENRLPYLRGQMGELAKLPDFGSLDHPRWGTAVVGVRDFLLAANLNFNPVADIRDVRAVAQEIRFQREHNNPALKGVRALAFELKSQGLVQLSLNLTEPNSTTFDQVYEFAMEMLADESPFLIDTELIGVIRERDVAGARHLTFDSSQVVR